MSRWSLFNVQEYLVMSVTARCGMQKTNKAKIANFIVISMYLCLKVCYK